MSGTELSRVRTEFRLPLLEPINKSPLESNGAGVVMQSSGLHRLIHIRELHLSEPSTKHSLEWPVRSQSACAPPRRLAAYGNTNKYRPVIICKANGTTASSPIQRAYLPPSTSTKLKMMAAVIMMDSQR